MPKVRFGVQTGQQETTWPQLRETWLELEELGFDDLWVYDHYLPTGTTLEDGDVTDAWSLLAALSQVVKQPRLGTLVTSATFRHPAALAKIAATVDHASNGRVILGIGAGWHQPEHHAYDIPFPGIGERIRRLEETIRVIRLLWTEERADFDGRYFQLRNAPFQPKPIQKPHPPILVGGAGEKLTLPLVARVADDWNWNITGTPRRLPTQTKNPPRPLPQCRSRPYRHLPFPQHGLPHQRRPQKNRLGPQRKHQKRRYFHRRGREEHPRRQS